MWSIFSQYSQKTPHSSPIRASYGVSFVDPASDWHSASVPVIIYAIFFILWRFNAKVHELQCFGNGVSTYGSLALRHQFHIFFAYSIYLIFSLQSYQSRVYCSRLANFWKLFGVVLFAATRTIQKVDPKLQRTLKAKSSFKSYIDNKYAWIYELDAGL